VRNPVCQISTASAPWELPGSSMPKITNLAWRLRSRTRSCAASSVAEASVIVPRVDQWPVKEGPVASSHEPLAKLLQPWQIGARDLANPNRVERDSSDQGTQHPEDLELAARLDLQKEVGLLGRGRTLLINDDHSPAGPPVGNETPPRF